MEHLQIVAFPLTTFRPRDFLTRKVKVDFQSVDEWKAWLSLIQADDIEWRPPHWDLGEMTWSVERKSEVLLVGMDVVVAYYPSYIRRQYGLVATLSAIFVPQPLPAMSRQFLSAYRDRWDCRLKRGPDPSFAVQLPDGYAEYMEIEAGKVRMRVEEKAEERKKQRRH